MTDARIVLTTSGNKEEAKKIAHSLVERRLAACVNIVGPIMSVYRWKDGIESSQEFLLLIKTTREAFTQIQEAIQELHSYELPEFVELEISRGEGKYLNWIEKSVR
jgi:periplasmic divalent cation tolerance protein